MNDTRLPATISISMVLHGVGAGVWLYMSAISKQQQTRVLSNVELMINVRPVAARPAGQSSTWNFLKMALPTVQRETPMDVQAPKTETRPRLMQDHMLRENQSRLQRRLELEAEKDMGHHKVSSLDALSAASSSHSRVKLAEAGRLEDVGARRASKSAIAMDDALVESGHSSGARAQGLSDLDAAPMASHSRSVAPMATLSDEGGSAASSGRSGRRSSMDSLASLLPSDPGYGHGHSGPMGAGDGDMEAAPAPARHHVEAIAEKKKVSMIEGPLKHRRVLHYEIPRFPAWAQKQGILEAIVRIRFSVAPSGEVLEEMRLVQTSGYGDLDRLAMDSLKEWRFQAKSEDSGNEWGIITFRFVLE